MHTLAARLLSDSERPTRHATSRRLGRALTLLPLLLALVGVGSAQAGGPLQVTPELRNRSLSVIRQVLDREHRFVKVHAAEYLLSLGYAQGVKETFDKQLQTHGGELQYRIGIWRVLAAATRVGSNSRSGPKRFWAWC